MSKTAKQFSPTEVANKLGISPQAVIKKIQNTLKQEQNPKMEVSNCLPKGLTVNQFGRFFVVNAEAGFKFKKVKK